VEGRTLVLNSNWTAITTTPVRQALVLLCREAAAAICPTSYEVFDLEGWLVRSIERAGALARSRVVKTTAFPVEKPEVILLRRYGGSPRRDVAFSRRNLYRRDGFACQYCGRRRPPDELSIDHVVPRSRGGATNWENCVLACVRCNSKKADKTPRERGLRLRRPPKKPTWSALTEALPAERPESWTSFIPAKLR